MKGILGIAIGHTVTAFRERVTLFWFLVFPLLVMTLLTLVLSGVTESNDISFPISIVNRESSDAPFDFAQTIESMLLDLGRSEAGMQPLFWIHRPDGQDVEAFLASELDALRVGRRSAVIVLDEGFNDVAMAAATGTSAVPAEIQVYTSGGRASSEMAKGILEQVFAGLNQQTLTTVGRFDPERALTLRAETLGSGTRTWKFVNFLLPGVLLMACFTAGLFGVPGFLLERREWGILKRYWVTPLSVARYLVGFSIGQLLVCAIQFIMITLLAQLALGATVNLLQPLPLAFLLLASLTFLAFGFMIAALSKTENGGMAIANIINMPMMFLGGLFFPIGELPVALRVVMFANPLTYLGDGLRTALGVETGLFPFWLTLLVPSGWLVVCTIVAALRLRWDVAR